MCSSGAVELHNDQLMASPATSFPVRPAGASSSVRFAALSTKVTSGKTKSDTTKPTTWNDSVNEPAD